MKDPLLEKLNNEEEIEEEEIESLESPSANERIVYIIQNSSKDVRMNFFAEDKRYEISHLFEYGMPFKKKDDVVLERSVLLSCLSDFARPKEKYISCNVDELVSGMALDIYVDFFSQISLLKEKRKSADELPEKIPEKVITVNSYFKGARADLKKVIDKLTILCEGIEPALEYVDEFQELKHIIGSNILLKHYPSEESRKNVMSDLNSGKIQPSNSFIYTVIKYHQALLNNLG